MARELQLKSLVIRDKPAPSGTTSEHRKVNTGARTVSVKGPEDLLNSVEHDGPCFIRWELGTQIECCPCLELRFELLPHQFVGR